MFDCLSRFFFNSYGVFVGYGPLNRFFTAFRTCDFSRFCQILTGRRLQLQSDNAHAKTFCAAKIKTCFGGHVTYYLGLQTTFGVTFWTTFWHGETTNGWLKDGSFFVCCSNSTYFRYSSLFRVWFLISRVRLRYGWTCRSRFLVGMAARSSTSA